MNQDDFWDKLLAAYSRSDRFPEEHVCPRGIESGQPGRAVWSNDLTCSYCGSLHPDVTMERIIAGDVELEPTDKNYKVYVLNKGGKPFSQSYRAEGSPQGDDPFKWEWTTREMNQTKFYFQHLSVDQRKKFVNLYNDGTIKVGYPGRFYCRPFFMAPVEESK